MTGVMKSPTFCFALKRHTSMVDFNLIFEFDVPVIDLSYFYV